MLSTESRVALAEKDHTALRPFDERGWSKTEYGKLGSVVVSMDDERSEQEASAVYNVSSVLGCAACSG